MKNSLDDRFFEHRRLLPASFYARDALLVAQDLLGKIIRHNDVAIRITETESYSFPDDSANHCFRGKTPRNLSMWGPPGHAYVYVCYGMHMMLNIVTNQEHEGAAVLIRAGDIVSGYELISERRGGAKGINLLTGPGRVGQALAIDRSFSGHPLFIAGGLEVFDAPPIGVMLVGRRIGIDSAQAKDREALYRFADSASHSVSRKKEMR